MIDQASAIPLPPSISATDLFTKLAHNENICVIDVRREKAYSQATCLISGAARVTEESLLVYAKSAPKNALVVAYCVYGHEVSQNAASALGKLGLNAAFLEGGITEWQNLKLPVVARDA
jgi:thiosulfate sulfurtransferase